MFPFLLLSFLVFSSRFSQAEWRNWTQMSAQDKSSKSKDWPRVDSLYSNGSCLDNVWTQITSREPLKNDSETTWMYQFEPHSNALDHEILCCRGLICSQLCPCRLHLASKHPSLRTTDRSARVKISECLRILKLMPIHLYIHGAFANLYTPRVKIFRADKKKECGNGWGALQGVPRNRSLHQVKNCKECA